MAKVLQVVIYTAISDDAKLAAYAKLAGPAMQAAGGGVFGARRAGCSGRRRSDDADSGG